MPKSIRYSVVIPAYNEEALLPRAIESVLAQTYAPEEIIVVDDGSKDATAAVASSYSEVSCISKDNGGLAAARNTGIEAASYEYIAFLDSDDEWLPNYLENAHVRSRRDRGNNAIACSDRSVSEQSCL